jgi:O-antigen/teichoic acid export membrane protein
MTEVAEAKPTEPPRGTVPAAVDGGGGLLAGSSALLASRLVVAALGWSGMVLIAQRLSVEEFGQLSFVFGLLGLTTVVTNLGVGRVVLAALVGDHDDVATFAGTYIVLRAVLGLAGYGVAFVIVVLGGYPPVVVQATALGGLMVLIATPSHALDAVFQARMGMRTVAVADVIGQFGQLGLTVALVVWRPTLLWLVVPFVVNGVLVLAWKGRHLPALIRPHLCVRLAMWRTMLAAAVPLTIGYALQTLYFKVDLVMLSRLDTFESVGIYNVGYKFADVAVLLTAAVLIPAAPLLVRAWPDNVDEFRSVTRRLGGVLGLAAAFVAVHFALLAEPLISLLYGERYAVGAGAARVVVAAACLQIYVRIGLDVLVAAGRSRWYPWIALTGLVLNVGLNLVLIPAHSYRGAAAATLCSELVVLATMWVTVRRSMRVGGLVDMARLVKSALSALAAGVVGVVLMPIVPWPVVGLGAASTFAVVVGLSGAGRGLLSEGPAVRLSRRRRPR